MKTVKNLLIILLLIVSSNLFANDMFFCSELSVGTGAVFYGDSTIQNNNQVIKNNNGKKFIFTSDISAGLILDTRLRILVGGTFSTDFHIGTDCHSNFLDYGFFTGIRITPGLGGLGFGIDYVTGSRTDFVELPKQASYVNHSPWGNGFRFNVDYTFAFPSGFAPSLGFNWRQMPRGGSVDNIVAIYLKLAL